MNCKVCGGEEFTKEDCYYYCNECQTRCEELVERIVVEDFTDKDYFVVKKRISSNKIVAEDGYQWTTWEAYNHILKGMVDELIKLGASPKLKITVLQLWIRYLQIIKAAFLPPGCLPKLGPSYNPRDAKIVYSISMKGSVKRKRHGDSSLSKSSFMQFKQSRGRARAALAKSVQSQSEVSSDISTCASELSSASSRPVRKVKYMTKEGIEWEKKKKDGKICGRDKDPSLVARMSSLKLLGILHLGLLLNEDNVQLSDMLRWIREGHISYFSLTHLLPENMVLNGRDMSLFGGHWTTLSYSMVRKVAGKLAPTLGIESIPLPDFPSLIARYVKELELPEEMAKVAVNLWAAYPPKMEIIKVGKSKDEVAMLPINEWAADSPQKKHDKEGRSTKYASKLGKGATELPNYEGRAMAIILYSMKLIFGLDGFTELKLSQFARKANKILSLHHGHKEFFVWGDWVKYIEFRKQLVERYHFPSSYNNEPEEVHMFRNPSSTVPPLPPSQSFYKCLKFLDHFSEQYVRCGKKSEVEWRQFMKKELDEILENEVQSPIERLHVNFEPSVTPYFSYFNQLHDNIVLRKSWSHNVNGVPCEQLFNASFHGTSLAFVLSPRSCIKDLNEKGVSVTVVEGSACSVGDFKLVKPVQIIRETNSKISIKKKESVEVVLTDDSVSSKKKISWFEKIDKAKLFPNLSSKKKVSSSVAADHDVLRTPKKNLRQSTKKYKKSKQSRKQKMKNSSKELGEEKLTLYLPHRKLWMHYGSFTELTEVQFHYLTQRFSYSFQWLLNLCAKNLEMSEVSLYSELVDVELVHKSNQNLHMSTKTRTTTDTFYEHRKTIFARDNW